MKVASKEQIFGCAMGSPISPVLADLVMEVTEETAITTALHPFQMVFRYVDDSQACLKKYQVDEFYQQRQYSVHFILKLENTNGQGLPFLDTITSSCGTSTVQVDVYRKLIQQSAASIFTLPTPYATKDPWLTRYFFVQETFLPRVKKNGRKFNEFKRYIERTRTAHPLSINVEERW